MTKSTKVPAQKINAVFAALETRLIGCLSFDLQVQAGQLVNFIARTSNDLCNAAQKKMTDTDFEFIAHRIATINTNGVGLDQVKTCGKVVNLINAFALDQEKWLCSFLKITTLSTLEHGGSLTVREMVCSLSKVALRDNQTWAVREGFSSYSTYSVGTGSSQAAQCRQAFRMFNFYDGFVKGGKDNAPQLTAYGEANLRGLVFKNK